MAWETLRLLADGIEPRPTRTGAAWNRDHLRTSISAGTPCGTKAPAVSWPTASTRSGSVTCSTATRKPCRPAALSPIVTTRFGDARNWLRGPQPAVLAAVERGGV